MRHLPGAVLLGLGSGLVALWLGHAVPAAEPALTATPVADVADEIQFMNLVLTADTQGEMLPCGRCKTNAGGLARRASVIAASRDTADHMLVADGGDLFLPGGPDPQVETFLIGMLAKLGYTVFGVGEADLTRGKSHLETLVAPHPGLQWVSANILDAATRQRVFKPYVLRQVGTAVVGFTSVLEPKLWQAESAAQPGILVEPCRESLLRIMPAMRKECDLVVCFAHAQYREVRQICADIEGLDIVVASHKARIENYPRRIGYAKQVYFAGSRGRFINWATVRIAAGGADPLNGRTLYLVDSIAEDSTVVREVLAFLGTSEPPAMGEGPGGEGEEPVAPGDSGDAVPEEGVPGSPR